MDIEKKLSDLPVKDSVDDDDLIVIVTANNELMLVPLSKLEASLNQGA